MTNLGTVYNDLGKPEKSLANLNEALRLMRVSANRAREAMILNTLGRAYQSAKQKEKAADSWRQAIAFSREFKTPKTEIVALYALAQINLEQNNLDEARAHIEAALAVAERLRSGIGSQQLRASYFASVQNYYDLATQIPMQMHRNRPAENLDALALTLHEKSRARSLLELLLEARTEIRQNIAPKLLEEEKSIQQMLSAKAARQTQILSGKHTNEQTAAIAKEISDLTDPYEQIQTEIRPTSPRYAALVQPQLVSLQAIQADLLDKDTALLEYSLGAEKSYLWLVALDKLESFELPKREIIEAQARKAYEFLIARTNGKKMKHQNSVARDGDFTNK